MNKKLLKYYCKICKNKVSFYSALYGSGICRKCASSGSNNGNYKHGKRTLNYYNFCIDCDKKISNRAIRCYFCASRKENNPMFGKHHSIDAKQKQRTKKLIIYNGKNNPNWQGGISFEPYPSEFNEILKESIRERDEYVCQLCYKTELKESQELNRKLHVHHIDYNKYNCNEENLIILCHRCNSKVNFNRDYWFAYFTEIINNCLKSNKVFS